MADIPVDQFLGPWVYCAQHLEAHRSGWCEVGLDQKVGLGQFNGDSGAQEAAAREKCRRLGLKLGHDSGKP